MDQTDCVVIGAGVIGLAIARQIAMSGREVIILESQKSIGTGISSRNSEVIHSGIYYRPGSLKARLCVTGQRMLYDYCAEHRIPTKRCGKLIVSTNPEQSEKLNQLWNNALANNVENLQRVTKASAVAMEPELRCVEALFSPDTGIIDSHAYMLQLLADAESAGANIAFQSKVTGVEINVNDFVLHISNNTDSNFTLTSTWLINATGLSATTLAKSFHGFPSDFIPTIAFAKGSYFSLSGRSPFSKLVYPIPEPGGLGTHLTLDLAGQARFGPDVEWLDTDDEQQIDFQVDPTRSKKFYESIRCYWPALRDASLTPAYAGVRPKLARDGRESDFRIQGFEEHGVRGLINLFGIESPGLTASLAIAQYVNDCLK